MDKEIFGEGGIQSLESILNFYSARRVFLVTGKKSYELSGAKEKLEDLLGKRDFHRHFEFEENPKFPDLLQGAKTVNAYKPDIIVAVGGGSVMDTAKILSVLPTDSLEAKKIIKGEIGFQEKIAPIVSIPTTSGSGSEATHFAVAYLNNLKYSVAGKSLLPDHVILDPELTYSMPPYQTAVSGMDALCQAIESYWAVDANEESRNFAKIAISHLLPNFETAVLKPGTGNRRAMSLGSFYAGKAINISKTTAVHALAYYLTDRHNIPHGEAVGINIDRFSEINIPQLPEKHRSNILQMFGKESVSDLVVYLKDLKKKIGLKESLHSIPGLDIFKYIDSVNLQRLSNNPVKLDKQKLVQILN